MFPEYIFALGGGGKRTVFGMFGARYQKVDLHNINNISEWLNEDRARWLIEKLLKSGGNYTICIIDTEVRNYDKDKKLVMKINDYITSIRQSLSREYTRLGNIVFRYYHMSHQEGAPLDITNISGKRAIQNIKNYIVNNGYGKYYWINYIPKNNKDIENLDKECFGDVKLETFQECLKKVNLNELDFSNGVNRIRGLSKAIFYMALSDDVQKFPTPGGNDKVAIIVGLGGGTGSGMFIDLIQTMLRQVRVPITVFAIMPTTNESDNELANAYISLFEIERSVSDVNSRFGQFVNIVLVPIEITGYRGEGGQAGTVNPMLERDFPESFLYTLMSYYHAQQGAGEDPFKTHQKSVRPFILANSVILRILPQDKAVKVFEEVIDYIDEYVDLTNSKLIEIFDGFKGESKFELTGHELEYIRKELEDIANLIELYNKINDDKAVEKDLNDAVQEIGRYIKNIDDFVKGISSLSVHVIVNDLLRGLNTLGSQFSELSERHKLNQTRLRLFRLLSKWLNLLARKIEIMRRSDPQSLSGFLAVLFARYENLDQLGNDLRNLEARYIDDYASIEDELRRIEEEIREVKEEIEKDEELNKMVRDYSDIFDDLERLFTEQNSIDQILQELNTSLNTFISLVINLRRKELEKIRTVDDLLGNDDEFKNAKTKFENFVVPLLRKYGIDIPQNIVDMQCNKILNHKRHFENRRKLLGYNEEAYIGMKNIQTEFDRSHFTLFRIDGPDENDRNRCAYYVDVRYRDEKTGESYNLDINFIKMKIESKLNDILSDIRKHIRNNDTYGSGDISFDNMGRIDKDTLLEIIAKDKFEEKQRIEEERDRIKRQKDIVYSAISYITNLRNIISKLERSIGDYNSVLNKFECHIAEDKFIFELGINFAGDVQDLINKSDTVRSTVNNTLRDTLEHVIVNGGKYIGYRYEYIFDEETLTFDRVNLYINIPEKINSDNIETEDIQRRLSNRYFSQIRNAIFRGTSNVAIMNNAYRDSIALTIFCVGTFLDNLSFIREYSNRYFERLQVEGDGSYIRHIYGLEWGKYYIRRLIDDNEIKRIYINQKTDEIIEELDKFYDEKVIVDVNSCGGE